MATLEYHNPISRRHVNFQDRSKIAGIAVGGAVALAAILAVMVVYILRRHDRIQRAKQRDVDVEVAFSENKKLASNIRSSRPRGTSMSHRSSFIPFFPSQQTTDPIVISTENVEDSPPTAKTMKRLSPQRILSRFSTGLRDSWPLGSSMPASLRLQSQSSVTLNQVAPPGYLIPSELKWPKRTYSRNTKTKVFLLAEGTNSSYFTDPPSPSPGPRRSLKRRAASENQLSTLLRSTSERLRTTHRRSLSRTLTAIGRYPGVPPSERLPTPTKMKSESKEVLIDRHSIGSASSSFSYLIRTPSPDKKVPRIAGRVPTKRVASPSPSVGSDDSLCGIDTPDLVIPSALTSPNKNGTRGEQRHPIRISSNGTNDISTMIHQESRPSVLALGRQDSDPNELFLPSPHRISLPSDPFYSAVGSAKPVVPRSPVMGPRPLYIRKATFGPEATRERPLSFTAPLKAISGNRQSPPKPPNLPSPLGTSQESGTNPFRWSPQEAIRTRSTSPKRSEPNRKRCHKRSKVVRLSGLPRPSSFGMVPEESEEECLSMRLDAPQPSVRLVQPSKSPSPLPSSMSRKLSVHPPTSAIFNPCVSVPKLVAGRTDDSPTLGLEIYSPTLAVTNYYTEPTSEDEFFKHSRSSSRSPKRSATMTHKRRESSVSKISPSTKLEEMISFPVENESSKAKSPALSPNSEILKALEDHKSPPHLRTSAILPAPPVITIPIPGHLTGPRDPPRRYSSQKLPQKNSLHHSICLLRRMNSEISSYESSSSLYSNSSPSSHPELPVLVRSNLAPSPSPSPERQHNSNRGSKHYLSIGASSPPKQRQRVEKRDSARLKREKRQRQRDQSLADLESGEELTPMKEISNPTTGANRVEIVGLRLPTLSNEGSATKPDEAPSDEPFEYETRKTTRWSDAMQKPSVKSIRHESQIEHPSPVDPPKWSWARESKITLVTTSISTDGQENALGKNGNRSPARSEGSEGNHSPEGVILPTLAPGIKVDHMGWEATKKKRGWGNWNGNHGRPDSLGLYDSEGFLKSSPDREALERGSMGGLGRR